MENVWVSKARKNASDRAAYPEHPVCGEGCRFYEGGSCLYERDALGVSEGDVCSTEWAYGVEPEWLR